MLFPSAFDSANANSQACLNNGSFMTCADPNKNCREQIIESHTVELNTMTGSICGPKFAIQEILSPETRAKNTGHFSLWESCSRLLYMH
jgi:hypothetical protein